MKKLLIVFLAIAVLLFSCTGAPGPDSNGVAGPTEADSPAEDTVPEPDAEAEGSSPPMEEPPPLAVEEPAEEPFDDPQGSPLEADAVVEGDTADEPDGTEPVLAEAETPEPEPEPVLVAEAEPEPEPVQEPSASAVPEPVPEPEPPAAPVIAVVDEPPPLPPPPAAPVLPPAPPPPPVQPPVQTPPQVLPPPPPPALPVEEPEAPAPAREPVPRVVPELPFPNPGVRGPQNEVVNFSRVVRATVGQLVEIPFRGSGWVYLGEAASRRGIMYDSRRLDLEGQSFIFRTELAGTYILRFSRQDFIRDFIFNDHVQVIVGDAGETAGTGWFNPPVDRGRVVAEPRWPSSLDEAMALRGNTRPATPQPSDEATVTPAIPPVTAPAATPPADNPSESPAAVPAASPTPPPSAVPPAALPDESAPLAGAEPQAPDLPQYSADEYLGKAKEEFDAGRVAAAILLLDQLAALSPTADLPDELYWLYGQFYEANSPSRNIRLALDYYRRLISEYPQSVRCNDAQRRISYLERYFINNR